MKSKKRCPICGKKMFYSKESKDFICKRCNYPDTEKIIQWQNHRRQTHKPRNIYTMIRDKISGKLRVKMEIEE